MTKTCKKCGSQEMYASGQCIPCKKAYAHNYRKLNKDKVIESKAKHYQANKVIVLEKNSEYRKNNLDIIKQTLAEYRQSNREKLRAAAVEYRKKNNEKISLYRETNREKLNAKSEAYRKANLNIFKVLSHNRRARVASVGGRLSKNIEKKLYALQNGKCACCGLPLGKDFHIDHIMPIALGGTNTDDNVQLLRKRCNLQKSAKHPVEFMQSKGFLL